MGADEACLAMGAEAFDRTNATASSLLASDFPQRKQCLGKMGLMRFSIRPLPVTSNVIAGAAWPKRKGQHVEARRPMRLL
jgi:hypothetical protein